MNYKYCLVCACKGMTSQLQSKVPPQISCATGLGSAYLIYTVQGVRAAGLQLAPLIYARI